jgi:hypothetical protein
LNQVRSLGGDFEDVDARSFAQLPTQVGSHVYLSKRACDHDALVVKFSEAGRAGEEITRAQQIQERVRSLLPEECRELIPEPILHGHIGSLYYLVEREISVTHPRVDWTSWNQLVEACAVSLKALEKVHRVGQVRQHPREPSLLVESLNGQLQPYLQGRFQSIRLRNLDGVCAWLSSVMDANGLEFGLVHGDFHLGNVLLERGPLRVVGIVDWGRAQWDYPLFVDRYTIVLTAFSEYWNIDLGKMVNEALRAARGGGRARWLNDLLQALTWLDPASSTQERAARVVFTWLHHVVGNLVNEDSRRSDFLWMWRNIDTALDGAPMKTGMVS